MKSLIQDATACILAIGLLLLACRSTLKRWAELSRYAKKIFAEAKPAIAARGRQLDQPTDAPIFGRAERLAISGCMLLLGVWLAIDSLDENPVTKREAVFIALKVGAVVSLLALRFLARIGDALISMAKVVEGLLGVLASIASQPNQTPEPTPMAVTPPAAQEPRQP